MGAVDFATTIAPGLRDVLLTGKAVEVVRRRDKTASDSYDAVVLDAPPTGRIAKFLNVNSEMSGLAKAGPIRKHADLVMSRDPRPRAAPCTSSPCSRRCRSRRRSTASPSSMPSTFRWAASSST